MNELSRLVYKASKGEVRVDELTQDATALARFELSPEEQLVLRRSLEKGQFFDLGLQADGGWF